ncbi:hypothetical protein BurJ1DRAFT_2647 [Burkholderiales bacterium JOSHI_001]|nr:hypothetical protein BurJ1DRAFT_2647 [Burkholderiales bacterium JOSHI_001]
MLTVTQAQMDVLDTQWITRMVDRVRSAVRASADMAALARDGAPVTPVDDAAIDKCIAWGVDFGLTEAADLACAAALLVAIRQHDHQGQLAWMKSWLDSPQASPPVRLQLVLAQLRDLIATRPVAARVHAQVERARKGMEAR